MCVLVASCEGLEDTGVRAESWLVSGLQSSSSVKGLFYPGWIYSKCKML